MERKERRGKQLIAPLSIKIDLDTRITIERVADARGITLSEVAREVLTGWAKRQQRRTA